MKKSTVKSKSKAALDKMECAGHWTEGNIWFKIGLCKTEAAMLKAIAGHIYKPKIKSAEAALLLLRTALAHYDVIESLMIRDEKYIEDEGFQWMDKYLKGLIMQQQRKITGSEK